MAANLESKQMDATHTAPDVDEQILAERIRICEILDAHAAAGWIDPDVLPRLINLIGNPERWEQIKSAGGDSRQFIDQPRG
jgi:hypothetical protein